MLNIIAANLAPTTIATFTVDYLVIAGGGGGGGGIVGGNGGGGGGAGGLRSTVTATGGGGSLESALTLNLGTNYTVQLAQVVMVVLDLQFVRVQMAAILFLRP